MVKYFTYEEKYWHACAPMNEARCAFSAVIGADKKIYVMGGFRKGKNLDHVERYCPETDQWEALAPMKES